MCIYMYIYLFIGTYSYKPDTTYCYSGNKGYINVNWNKHNKDGPTTQGKMFMIAIPHQVIYIVNNILMFALNYSRQRQKYRSG